jgi:hypothetical protein
LDAVEPSENAGLRARYCHVLLTIVTVTNPPDPDKSDIQGNPHYPFSAHLWDLFILFLSFPCSPKSNLFSAPKIAFLECGMWNYDRNYVRQAV